MGARVVLSLDDQIVSEVELTKAVTLVGRHPACDVVVDHPAISGRHLALRKVGKTVYAEDLGSTNGTKINGLPISNQVIHHLDLVEIGKHKLHYFDEEMLAGRVGGLENTVQTDFERTMMAAHVQPPPAAAPPKAAAEDLARTVLIPRLGPSQETVRTEAEAGALALRVLTGGRAGEIVALSRTNTMIGEPGGDTALVIRRGRAFFIARLSGNSVPKLNRQEVPPGTHPIGPRDTIDVGGWSFEVIDAAT